MFINQYLHLMHLVTSFYVLQHVVFQATRALHLNCAALGLLLGVNVVVANNFSIVLLTESLFDISLERCFCVSAGT